MSKKRTFDDEGNDVDTAVAVSNKTNPTDSQKGKKKALPPGYVCKACGMKDDHAIYNCPLAVKKAKLAKEESLATEKDSTAIETKKEEVPATAVTDEPSTNPLTAFITGLPFKINRNALINIFQNEGIGSELTGKDVRLVMFDDKPDKCRGLAYVTFKTEEECNKAFELNGKEYEGRTLQIVPCKAFNKVDNNHKGNMKATFNNRKGKLPEGVVHIQRCYRCGQLHDPNQCTNKRICYKCKSTEHLSSQCPMKKPKVST